MRVKDKPHFGLPLDFPHTNLDFLHTNLVPSSIYNTEVDRFTNERHSKFGWLENVCNSAVALHKEDA